MEACSDMLLPGENRGPSGPEAAIQPQENTKEGKPARRTHHYPREVWVLSWDRGGHPGSQSPPPPPRPAGPVPSSHFRCARLPLSQSGPLHHPTAPSSALPCLYPLTPDPVLLPPAWPGPPTCALVQVAGFVAVPHAAGHQGWGHTLAALQVLQLLRPGSQGGPGQGEGSLGQRYTGDLTSEVWAL